MIVSFDMCNSFNFGAIEVDSTNMVAVVMAVDYMGSWDAGGVSNSPEKAMSDGWREINDYSPFAENKGKGWEVSRVLEILKLVITLISSFSHHVGPVSVRLDGIPSWANWQTYSFTRDWRELRIPVN